MTGPEVHSRLRRFLAPRLSTTDVDDLEAVLRDLGVYDFPELPTGLYSAVREPDPVTGYQHTWLRDTVHIVHARWELGETDAVERAVSALLDWIDVQAPRFDAAIAGISDVSDPMQRPHVRFDGLTLREVDQWWPHAQNDAWGYVLWLVARAMLAGITPFDARAVGALARIARYLGAVEYWRDADSGHWEEYRRVSASSVGAALAGLRAFAGLVRSPRIADEPELRAALADADLSTTSLDVLVAKGRTTLEAILPAECVAPDDPSLARATDAALLFLVHPLFVAPPAMTGRVVADVRAKLEGPWGVRRYVGDSYWCADYTSLLDAEKRTAGFGEDISDRDRALIPGTEAQWCLFDPVLSCIYARRFLATRDAEDAATQIRHLQRALRQITHDDDPAGAGLCPEAYWVPDGERPEHRVVNENTPLLWTQALLVQAVAALRTTVAALDAT